MVSVPSALEDRGVIPAGWGCASSSVVSACFAASGKSRELGLDYWKQTADRSHREGMSRILKSSILEYGSMFAEGIFAVGAPRMLIAASYVNNPSARARSRKPQKRNCKESASCSACIVAIPSGWTRI